MKLTLNKLAAAMWRRANRIPQNEWSEPPNMGRYLCDRLALRLISGGGKRTIRNTGLTVNVNE